MTFSSLRLTRLGALSAVASALVLVACGGGDAEKSGDDFIAGADAICIDYAEQGIDSFTEVGEVTTAEDAIALAERQREVQDGLATELEGLDAPSDDEETFAAYIEQIGEVKQGFDDQAAAASKDDPEGFQQAAQATDEANIAANESAEELGFDACAERLPADAEAEVSEVIERTGTTDDSAHCEEDYTTRFVDKNYGNLEECKLEQERGKQEPADSVEINEIRGYDGVAARATVVPSGGDFDGQSISLTLAYEDDRWKIDTAQAAGAPE